MNVVAHLHDRFVHNRRIRILSEHLIKLIPRRSRVLDVGCGDGLLAARISQKLPEIEIRGVDVLVRDKTHIPVERFDGRTILHNSSTFDSVMFVDVLHHTKDPMLLLHEAVRVARRAIIIKDHLGNGALDKVTLQLMDWVGNGPHGVPLVYNYWSQQNWLHAFNSLDLRIEEWIEDLRIYPLPANWIFGRSLHFIAKLIIS